MALFYEGLLELRCRMSVSSSVALDFFEFCQRTLVTIGKLFYFTG